ncbi:MAG TPA: YadA C-terminal domain-containing protein, partial [Rhodanobacteraceae bacterium]|nr:YadA C-terminal domain-containing protein [Rhodanobacteraceae bacterium]
VADPVFAHDAVTLGYLQANYSTTATINNLSSEIEQLSQEMKSLQAATTSTQTMASNQPSSTAPSDGSSGSTAASDLPARSASSTGSDMSQAVSDANAYTNQQTAEALSSAQTYSQAGDQATLDSAKAYTDQAVSGVQTQLDSFEQQTNARFHEQDRRIDRISAMSTAMVQMAASAAGIDTDNRVGVGYGNTSGQSALSVGYQRKISPQATLTIGGAVSNGESSVGAGVGFGW